MEPLLYMIRRRMKGVFFKGERTHRPWLQGYWKEWDNLEQCVKTKDSDYVDDVNICIQDEEDLTTVDGIFLKFEEMSGAILILKPRTSELKIGGGRKCCYHRFARHTYRKFLVNLEVSSFLNVSNLLSVSRASSKESKRPI